MLTNLFHPVATGSATQILGSSRELASFGHHIVVITAQVDPSTPDSEVMGGFKLSRLPALRLSRMSIALNFPWLNWTFWPVNLRSMEAIIRRHDIDLLHVHNHMFDMAFAGMVFKARAWHRMYGGDAYQQSRANYIERRYPRAGRTG